MLGIYETFIGWGFHVCIRFTPMKHISSSPHTHCTNSIYENLKELQSTPKTKHSRFFTSPPHYSFHFFRSFAYLSSISSILMVAIWNYATSPKCNLYESQSGLTFSGSRSYYIYIPYQTTFHKLYPGFDLVISIRNVVQIAKALGEMSIGMDTASENRIIRREFNGIKQRDESKAFV